jgi:hypothetical protein
MRRLGLLAAVLALALAGVVRADTTIVGSPTLPAGGADSDVGTNVPAFQNIAGDGSYVVSSPVDGVLTSWSFRNTNMTAGDQLELRVIRPVDVGPTHYRVISTSAPQTVSADLDVVQGPFAVDLPLQAGDRLALQSISPNGDVPVLSSVAGGDFAFMTTPSLLDGGTSGFDDGNGGVPNMQQLLVQGTVTFTPSVTNPPPPVTTPATPTPPASQSIASLSPPVEGRSVDVAPVSGTVLVRIPPSTRFLPLASTGRQIPVGAEIDVTHGRIRLTAANAANSNATKTADFYDGRFRISQPAGAAGIVDLTLTGPLATCTSFTTKAPAKTTAHVAKAKATAKAAPKPRKRYVWGSGHGTFRTVGQGGSAAVRGTIWLVEDRCDGSTLVVVHRGVVAVHDDARDKTVLVPAGHRYLTRARH